MQYSIIVPVHNEAANIDAVLGEVSAVLAETPPAEIVVVDDGSDDGCAARVESLMPSHPGLRLVRHAQRAGKSAALRTGANAASSEWIVTMDGDGQNDPRDILRLLDHAAKRPGQDKPLVFGIRRVRQDGASRRIASLIANTIRRALLRDGCADAACGLKLFERRAFLLLPPFEGMHRFLPALFRAYGYEIEYLPVGDRPRLHGRSRYGNFGRGLAGFCDLLGVLWLTRRIHLPQAAERAAARREAAATPVHEVT